MHTSQFAPSPAFSFARIALPAVAGYFIGRAAATPTYPIAPYPPYGGGWGPYPGYGGGYGHGYGHGHGRGHDGWGHGYGYDHGYWGPPRRSPGHAVLHAAATLGGWFAGSAAGSRMAHGRTGAALNDSRFGAWFAHNTGAPASGLLRPLGGIAGALLGHLFTR